MLEIREIEENDFKSVYKLFHQRKSHSLIKWLYGHPCANGKSAYVAIENGELIGCIGYTKQNYAINKTIYTGLTPLSWEVNKENRGLAGVKLLMKALSGADFYFGLDGSADMKTVFKQMGFKPVGHVVGARKILKPLNFLKSLNEIGPRDIYRTLKHIISYPFHLSQSSKRFNLSKITDYDFKPIDLQEGKFQNVIDTEHLNWLNSNPEIETMAFECKVNNTIIAPIILGVKNTKGRYKRGIIIHLPFPTTQTYEENDELISHIEWYLKTLDASSVSVLTAGEKSHEIYKKRGYNFEPKQRPVTAKGPKEIIEKLMNCEPLLSYAVSDKCIRNI